MADILRQLGNEEVSRLRIGIGAPPGGREAADFVLGKFGKQEQVEIDIAIAEAADAVVTWTCTGITTAMNQHNRSPGD